MRENLDHSSAAAVVGAEPFAAEIALALDDIEALTRDECAGIMYLGQIKRVEPVLAFLSLHVKLAFVLCSPHGRAFADSLRAWDANASIERKIAHHWPRYRSNWTARRGLDDATIEALCNNPVASWVIGVRSTEAQVTCNRGETAAEWKPDMPARREILERLTPGTVFRLRGRCWDEWLEMQVLKVSARGNFHLLRVGSKAKTPSVFDRKMLSSSEWSIEIVG